MRISKRLRDEAIEAALVMADWWEPWNREQSSIPVGDSKALDLAWHARDCAYARCYLTVPDGYREAAALLLDGWSPGDPVVRLGKRGNP